MSKLKDKRTDADMTQQELADLPSVNVDRSWIAKIENGTDCAPAWLADAIADALGTTRGRLFKVESERRNYRVKK